MLRLSEVICLHGFHCSKKHQEKEIVYSLPCHTFSNGNVFSLLENHLNLGISRVIRGPLVSFNHSKSFKVCLLSKEKFLQRAYNFRYISMLLKELINLCYKSLMKGQKANRGRRQDNPYKYWMRFQPMTRAFSMVF